MQRQSRVHGTYIQYICCIRSIYGVYVLNTVYGVYVVYGVFGMMFVLHFIG